MKSARAVIYARVSSEEQVKGHSLDGQRALLREWAEREGWEVVGEYSDEGISAKDLNRPALRRALADAAAGAFDLLLVRSRTRYSRDLADATATDKLLASYGVRVMSLDEPAANDDTPAGFLFRGITDVFSAHERLELGHRIRRGYETMATRKGLHVGDPPFGYSRPYPQQPMVVDEREATAIRWAFERYATGTVSYAGIADELYRRGYRPHSKRGRERWAVSTVSTMLKNRVYLGEVFYRGEWFAGAHPAIVSEALFSRAQAAATSRKRAPRAYGHNTHFYLLAGFSGCVECESNLWGDVAGNGKRYYLCSSRHSRVPCSTHGRSIRAEPVEERVERGIIGTADMIAGLAEAAYERAKAEQPLDVEAERGRLKESITRASRLMMGGGDERVALAAIGDANARLTALEDMPDPERVTKQLMSVGEMWGYLTPEDRRDAARVIFERVEVDIADGGVMVTPRPEYRSAYRAVADLGSGPVRYDVAGLVRPGGFEPPASASAGQRSIP